MQRTTDMRKTRRSSCLRTKSDHIIIPGRLLCFVRRFTVAPKAQNSRSHVVFPRFAVFRGASTCRQGLISGRFMGCNLELATNVAWFSLYAPDVGRKASHSSFPIHVLFLSAARRTNTTTSHSALPPTIRQCSNLKTLAKFWRGIG